MGQQLHLLVAALVAVGAFSACDKKAGGPEVVSITADEEGFKPSSVTLPKGSAGARLVFTRTSDDTCATDVEFPELGVKKDLPKNTPVTIEIPTDQERKLTFQCGMGMYKSSVVVAAK
jgi:plastocyanin domain-containing protein